MKNEQRRTQTVNAILAASLATLQEVGPSRFRTGDVSKRSGMSEGTTFRYFPSKLDLIVASLERALQDHLDRGTELFAELQRLVTIQSLLEGLWDLLSHPELRWTYELMSAAGADPVLQQAIAPVLKSYGLVADAAGAEALRAIGIPENVIEIAIDSVTWAMRALVNRNMGRGDWWTGERMIESLVFMSNRAFGLGSHQS